MLHHTQGETATRITSDIVNTIIKQITQRCQCTYTSSLIINSQLFCDNDKNQLIYQAKLLKSSGKPPTEIRRIIHDWVFSDTEPSIVIDSHLCKLDSSCSVIVQTLGNSTCIDHSSTIEATRQTPSSFEPATTIAGIALILVVIVIIVIFLAYYIGIRRSRKKTREIQRKHTPR